MLPVYLAPYGIGITSMRKLDCLLGHNPRLLKLKNFDFLTFSTLTRRVEMQINFCFTSCFDFSLQSRKKFLFQKRSIELLKMQKQVKTIKFYNNLPLNGQRTKTNASVAKRHKCFKDISWQEQS